MSGHLVCSKCGWRSPTFPKLNQDAADALHAHWRDAHPGELGISPGESLYRPEGIDG